MNKKLYYLKMQILREKGISDLLKKELADKIFQIEQELAINYKRCSTELCGYHKMCVRRKINTNICPTNCEDDTRQ